MASLDALIQDLVIANRILAKEDVVDAYGHVGVRHPDDPDRFLIARSLAPELVSPDDIVELDLDGRPVRDEGRSLYLERFIHAAIFAARPEVMAVVHAHAEDTLPFCIAGETKLRPVIHSGSFIGAEVPVWDIAGTHDTTHVRRAGCREAGELRISRNSVAPAGLDRTRRRAEGASDHDHNRNDNRNRRGIGNRHATGKGLTGSAIGMRFEGGRKGDLCRSHG
jgi:ribulose-5-phosphate 4-epimerase/fuculose-1-phosphate aldolase